MSNDFSPVLPLSSALIESLKLVLIAYIPAVVLGLGLSFLISLNASLYQILRRVLAIPAGIPAIALFPLALVHFQQNLPALLLVIAFSATWLMTLHLATGFRQLQTDPTLRRFGIQTIFLGLRTGLAMAWGTTIAGEMLAAGTQGVGFYLWDAYQRNVYPEIAQGVMAIAIVAFLLDQLLDGLGEVLGRAIAKK